MIAFIVSISALLVLFAIVLTIGVHLGGRYWRSEAQRVRYEAARTERKLHDLTREAFVAMAEHVRPNPRR